MSKRYFELKMTQTYHYFMCKNRKFYTHWLSAYVIIERFNNLQVMKEMLFELPNEG